MKYEKLFSPIKIRGMEMRNRIVFPAMGTKMPTEDKKVTQKLIDYHVARAKGGNGLNIVEVSSVHSPSAPKTFLSISEDEYIPGLKKLVDAVHDAGAKIGIQVWQGGTAVASDPEAMIVVPSDMPFPTPENIIPATTKETIEEIIVAFGEAARRAVEAGFDCIEFHGAHSYSPHTFLSAAFNRREDEYGGSLENRARYMLECIRSIRKNMPEDMPLFMRIDAHDDYLENGLTIEDIIQVCKWAEEAGVDVLDVSRGNMFSAAIKYEVPPVDLARGFNVDNAAKIREATGMLTVAVGRINHPEQAENILKENKADMVVMGRAQLADPEFCNKAKAGEVDDIVLCVGCNQGCFDGFVDPNMEHITCLRNPALGLEKEYALVETNKPKTILVAGGGFAGLEAAITLKRRGHNPILFEASDTLGGQFLLAGVAPRKEEMYEAAIAMGKQAEKEGIEIHMNTTVTPGLIKEIKPDEVVIAIGAEPMKLNIPGADLANITNSHDILAGNTTAQGNVVVIGGGLVGLEVAEFLVEKGNTVTLVEMLDEVGKDLGQLRKISVMESLYTSGVKTLTNAKCTKIDKENVIVEIAGKTKNVPYDYVVVAIGARSRPSQDLKNYCEDNNIPFHEIGDAVKARRALNATAEAARIARLIQ